MPGQHGRRGFASMDPEKQREIARKGGKAAHARGTAHEFTREEAVVAGRKGGRAAQARAHQQPAGTEELARSIPPPSEGGALAVEWHAGEFAGSYAR